MRVSRIGLALVTCVSIATLVLIVIFRAPLLRASVAAVLDFATGSRVAFAGLELHAGEAHARGVTLTLAGAGVFSADRIDARFNLRDLLPGGTRRYGLRRLELIGPRLSLTRQADGSFDPRPHVAAGGGVAAGALPSGPPWDLVVTVRGGSVALLDPQRVLPLSRHLSVDAVGATLELRGESVRYAGTGNVAGDVAQGFRFDGRIATGYALHRLQAPRIAIAPLVDYFINTDAARFLGGWARGLDLQAYAFGSGPGRLAAYHFVGGGTLVGGSMRVPGLLPPATGMSGRIDLFDGGIAAPALRARLGGVRVALAGGLYGWNAPAFRLGIAVPETPLRGLRAVFRFSRGLPLGGSARLATLLEGPVGSPLVATGLESAAFSYGAFPIRAAMGRAVYYAATVDVVGARGRYGGLAGTAEGALDLGAHTRTQLVVTLRGAARHVPYVAQLTPGAGLDAVALLAGVDLRFDARGEAAGTGAGARLDGLFHIDPQGEGTFGPFAVRRDGGSLAGAYFLDRHHDSSGFWLSSRDMAFVDLPAPPHLPGLALAPPQFAGRLDGALAGVGPPSAFRLAGHVRARDLHVGAVRIDEVSGDLAGAVANVRLGSVVARGPWGTFAGGGAYGGGRLVLAGDYRGDFRQLATLTGDVGATGPVRGPIALILDPKRTLVQAQDDRSPGAAVRGVPVDRLDGTLAVAGAQLRVYSATASVAGGTFSAAGLLDPQGDLGVSAAGAAVERIPALAQSGSGGRIAAIGTLRVVQRRPQFVGGLTVGDGASALQQPFAANGDVAVAGSRLELRRTDGLVGSATGSLAGNVSALGTARARYDLALHLVTARVAPLARAVAPGLRYVTGTASGDVRITGSGRDPVLAGTLALPEGSLNGLRFRDARAYVNVDATGLKARRGTVTVGSTAVAFGALLRGDDTAVRLQAPQADLSDFNDYFDAGDTLGGRGRVALRFRKHRGTVRTNADIAIAKLRYRRFDLGDATAKWSSRGPKVTGALAFGGASGHLDVAGTLVAAPRAPLAKLLARSRFDGTARLRGLDLGVWLPALGYQFPVGGRVDAEATISGPLRNPDVATKATLVDGSIGKFPVDRFVLAATSTLSRTTVTQAELDLPSLAVTASGTFGLAERDRVALALHAKSPNVGTFANRLFGTTLPLTGTGEVDVKIDGTRAKPHLTGGFDVEQASLRGVAIPRALGEFSERGRDVVLSDVEVGFATGTLYFAGSVPLEFAPFSVGPPQAPVTLEIAARGVDLGDFAPLLPVGSVLKGKIDGHVAIGGTAGDPRLRGNLALTEAALKTVDETVPLTNMGAELSFSGNEATLDRLHLDAGGGTLEGSGRATIPSLVHPSADAAYEFVAHANKLRLALPAYGSGQVDGTLSLTHAPHAAPVAAGTLVLADATIPFSALLLASGGGSSGFDASAPPPAAANPFALGFDLDVTADRNVRVRSANVDIGGRGTLHVGGVFGAPELSGGFTSTGGTLAYFNTVFRLVDGTVAFDPASGLVPTLNARAITHVIDPDPNTVRNVSGSADVTLDVSGPVTNLSIALSSNPAYERQQILGLLLNAPALGASNLFGETSQSATLYGSNATSNLAPGVAGVRNSNGQFSVAQEAFGIANAQFTRTLLAPIEATFASAVGLSSFNVNVDYTGSVGVSARKVLGKKVNALYGTTFGYPYRQTFGFEYKPNALTAAQLTAFQTLGANGLDSLTPTSYTTATNQRLQAAQPTGGSAGFSLSLQRLFP